MFPLIFEKITDFQKNEFGYEFGYPLCHQHSNADGYGSHAKLKKNSYEIRLTYYFH